MTRPQQNPLQKQKNKISAVHPLNNSKQTFREHITELRARILYSLTVLLMGTFVGYILIDEILHILLKPFQQSLIYTSPAGGFYFTFEISLFFGFIVFTPIFTYHLLRFVEPAIPQNSRYSLVYILIVSSILMLSGMTFAYYISLPAAFHFLAQFSSPKVQALISTDSYFSFVTRYLIGFGVLFQLPLVMLFVNKLTVLSAKQLMGFQKWIILSSFVVAAIITPTPDFFNQTLMAIPIILLYQVSVALILIVNRKTHLTSTPNIH